MNNKNISIVFSTFNELGLSFLETSLKSLSRFNDIEVICVDGGSTDGTTELIESLGAKLINSTSHSRAVRLNEGIAHCQNDLVLLHHPRSVIDPNCLSYIIEKELDWGGLTHKFDDSSPLLKFTSWYSNNIRAKIREIYYLDHCIFFKRSLLDNSSPVVPEAVIFEDTLFSQKLSRITSPTLIPFLSLTSSVRFKKNGEFKQALLNQLMKICFMLNVSYETMNKIYEKGLSLNTKY